LIGWRRSSKVWNLTELSAGAIYKQVTNVELPGDNWGWWKLYIQDERAAYLL
jgi:hypothetical protein